MPQIASRLKNLPTYVFVAISQQVQNIIAEGHDVIRLDIGNPDMPPPPNVIERLNRTAQDESKHGYSGYRGIPEFRQAVADYYVRCHGVKLDAFREVLPLLGSKEGIVNFILAHTDADNPTLLPDISYPAYGMGIQLADGYTIPVPLLAENDYLINFDSIPAEDAAKANMLWINYPNNPTGAVATAAFYEQAVTFCREHDILLASDNPYLEIVYDGSPPLSVLSAAGGKECAVEFISFSKTYNMAGWRLGAAVGNSDALANLLRVKSNVDSGHFKPIYEAGISALEETPSEWIADRNDIYRSRRDRIMEALPTMG
ncbi:MAG: aminotransferase class I/II-fold pyridoxal phosphate-dependent enzyme, partial [Chloroflexota bacterium]